MEILHKPTPVDHGSIKRVAAVKAVVRVHADAGAGTRFMMARVERRVRLQPLLSSLPRRLIAVLKLAF